MVLTFGRGSPKEHSCEMISKSIKLFSRRSRLKVFSLLLSLVAIMLNRVEQFEQCWYRGQPRTIPMK